MNQKEIADVIKTFADTPDGRAMQKEIVAQCPAVIKRPTDVWPDFILNEFRRLAAWPGPIATIHEDPNSDEFSCKVLVKRNEFSELMRTGNDIGGAVATVAWLREGPKIVQVNEQQYQALRHVEVNLPLSEIQLPYPTVMVTLPPGHTHKACLVHRYSPTILILEALSYDWLNDIVTLARCRGEGDPIERYLEKFQADSAEVAEETCQTMRVAVNMLLALTHFGHLEEYVFPREVDRDERLGKEKTPRGDKARERVKEQPRLLSLNRDVILHRVQGGERCTGEPTGREMPFHWRRGHWRVQHYGAGNALRKRIFLPPVMVRADLLTADPAETTTVYRS